MLKILLLLLFPYYLHAYPANLSKTKDDGSTIATVTSNTRAPVRCQLRLGSDSVWMELHNDSHSFKIIDRYQRENLSLSCLIIDAVQMKKPWRLHRYGDQTKYPQQHHGERQ